MSRHDWYRNRDWSEAIAAAFDAKFARTRQPWSRWQYLTIQAGMLGRRFPDAAAGLYLRSIELSGVEPSWLTVSYQRLAMLHLHRGERPEAIELLRKSIEACPRESRSIISGKSPEELLARLIWFDERAAAKELLGPAKAPDWGEIPDVPCDPGGHPYDDPEGAAESLVVAFHATDQLTAAQVDALFAADPGVLAAFDELLFHEPLFGLFYPWTDHGRFELPAFIGRCLVRTAGAEWIEADHIVDWELRIGERVFPLYPAIWPELARGVPLLGIYRELAGH